MLKSFFFPWLLMLACITNCVSQKVMMRMDETGRMSVELPQGASSRIVSTQQVLMTVTLDEHFPETQARFHISFPANFNISTLKSLNLWISKDDNVRYGKSIYFSNKAIDSQSRSLTTTVGGLKPGQTFRARLISTVNDPQYNCSGDFVSDITFTTAKEPTGRIKKLLFVMDKDLEGDTEIDNAITTYINDFTPYYPIIFEKIYLEDQNAQKDALRAKIKTDYANTANPLRYLFFLGSNASTNIIRQYLDPANNAPIYTYYDLSINFYTQIHTPEFGYDPDNDLFIQKTYQYCTFNGFPANDIGNAVFQSNSFDLAFGCLMPNGITPKRDYILNYFSKLHRFKTGAVSFAKSVLFADTFYHDGGAPATLAAINPRWQVNDTINVPQKFGSDFHGYDPVWNQDYTSKLSNKSYEIGMYFGHGAPNFHYFGISTGTIRDLPSLNTMLLDFNACSVGAFNQYDYLAGAYLEKGTTLFVKAFTTPIGIVTFNFDSPLIDFFREGALHSDISKRTFFGDAYLYNAGGTTLQVNLGDPLLQLDPPCGVENLTLTKPFYNATGTVVVAAKNAVNAQNKIIPPSISVYQAGRSITFENGFEVEKGVTFNARIQSCPE